MSKLDNITKGFSNLLLNKINVTSEELNELSEKRMDICKKCTFLSSLKFCKKCGCYMPAKTKVLNEECPEKYW